MPKVLKYHLQPTELVPNSPRPLLHYKNVIPLKTNSSDHRDSAAVWDLFTRNGWRVAWIFRYGPTQPAHFHSQAHECMAVLSGRATIRFGAADTSADLRESTHGSASEGGGVEVTAEAGGGFVIPAGVAHKTFDTDPESTFKLLTPGTGHGIDAEDPRKAMAEIELEGFTMLGAYSNGDWDFVTSGGDFEKSWMLPKPECDPVFRKEEDEEGLLKLWPELALDEMESFKAIGRVVKPAKIGQVGGW